MILINHNRNSYLKPTIKPHKLHYKYNFLGSAVGQLTNDEATETPFFEWQINNLETAHLDLHGFLKPRQIPDLLSFIYSVG